MAFAAWFQRTNMKIPEQAVRLNKKRSRIDIVVNSLWDIPVRVIQSNEPMSAYNPYAPHA